MSRRAFRIGTVVSVVVVSLGGLEAGLRTHDGFRLDAWSLRPTVTRSPTRSEAPRRADQYVTSRARPAGIDAAWFWLDPPPLSPIALTGDLLKRHEQYPRDPYAAFFEWNLNYLSQQACAKTPPEILATVDDYLYFSPPDQSLYPTYRHVRHATPSGWFTSNAFGWRGPEISLNKPPGTIRIAFVGASTTIAAYDYPYSHPELIEHWLNLWSLRRGWRYSFEAINAGRTGVDSHSIAAIVRQELLPVEPDLVVYYEGSNQFWPPDYLRYRFGRLYPRPRVTFQPRPGENSAALVRRAWQVVDRITGGDGSEPLKPPQRVVWPSAVDEQAPDPYSPDLPIQLPAIIADLDSMRAALEGIGSQLVVSSFIWMVDPGLRLDPARHAGLIRYLNQTFWPTSYENMRRFADFQNRVFARYAWVHHLPFVDISREFPRDPDLFADAIHLHYDGLRLQAWLYFEALVSLLEDRLQAGTLPRPVLVHRDIHPAFDQPVSTVALTELRSNCR